MKIEQFDFKIGRMVFFNSKYYCEASECDVLRLKDEISILSQANI